MRNCYLAPRRKHQAIDWMEVNKQRRMDFLAIIDSAGEIGDAQLKIRFGAGDGIFERTKRDVLQMYPEDVAYNSKTKIYTAIKPELEKPVLEISTSWESKR